MPKKRFPRRRSAMHPLQWAPSWHKELYRKPCAAHPVGVRRHAAFRCREPLPWGRWQRSDTSDTLAEITMEDIFETAKALERREKSLTTGCKMFDAWLQGGIVCRGITQIYGASGTGKTQLALQLCLTVQLPVTEGGLAAGAIYICTEHAFPSRRFQELIWKFEVTKKRGINGDSVFVEHISTIDQLEECLLHRIPVLMSVRKIGLIIVDSIAGPYRAEDWDDKSRYRAKSLRTIGQQLHKLCKNDDICVICINQISSVVENTQLYENETEKPSLGASWSSMVTNSIRFQKRDSHRYACIKLSSNIPESIVQFEIHRSGVRAIDEQKKG